MNDRDMAKLIDPDGAATATDTSDFSISKEDILNGEIFTKKQLIDCVIKQQKEVSLLVDTLKYAGKFTINVKSKKLIKKTLSLYNENKLAEYYK